MHSLMLGDLSCEKLLNSIFELSWNFPRQTSVGGTIFLSSSPVPGCPLKRMFYFYCRLAVSGNPPTLETPLVCYRLGFGPPARYSKKKTGKNYRKWPPPKNREKKKLKNRKMPLKTLFRAIFPIFGYFFPFFGGVIFSRRTQNLQPRRP